MKQELEFLRQMYDKLNADLFRGELPPANICFGVRNPKGGRVHIHAKNYGATSYDEKAACGTPKYTIALPKFAIYRSRLVLLSQLLHNMVHISNHIHGLVEADPSGALSGEHPKAFREKAGKIGMKVFIRVFEEESGKRSRYDCSCSVVGEDLAKKLRHDYPELDNAPEGWIIHVEADHIEDEIGVSVAATPADGRDGAVTIHLVASGWDTKKHSVEKVLWYMDSESEECGEIAWQLYGNRYVQREPFGRGLLLVPMEMEILNMDSLSANPMLLRKMFEAIFEALRLNCPFFAAAMNKEIQFAFLGCTSDVETDEMDNDEKEMAAGEARLEPVFREAQFAVFRCVEPLAVPEECYISFLNESALYSEAAAAALTSVDYIPETVEEDEEDLDF